MCSTYFVCSKSVVFTKFLPKSMKVNIPQCGNFANSLPRFYFFRETACLVYLIKKWYFSLFLCIFGWFIVLRIFQQGVAWSETCKMIQISYLIFVKNICQSLLYSDHYIFLSVQLIWNFQPLIFYCYKSHFCDNLRLHHWNWQFAIQFSQFRIRL